MVPHLGAAVPAEGRKLALTSHIPRLEQPDRRLHIDRIQATLYPQTTFKKTNELLDKKFPRGPERGPYYLGPLLSSFALDHYQVRITLSKCHSFTISSLLQADTRSYGFQVLAQPAPSKLIQHLTPYTPLPASPAQVRTTCALPCSH